MTKQAIATIQTEKGVGTVYYNGKGEYLTVEVGGEYEALEDGKPANIDEACELARACYNSAVWGFEMPFDLEALRNNGGDRMSNRTAKEHLDELLKLMTERPELPVVPMIFFDGCSEEDVWYKGDWGHAHITKFVESDERIYLYDEKDMEQCLCDFYGWDYEEWSEEKALKEYKALSWTECIAVYIDND